MKLAQVENVLAKRDKEIELMKSGEEKRKAAEERYIIRDRQTFENHFGYKPRAQEEKYITFMKMYENQAEKMRKELSM